MKSLLSSNEVKSLTTHNPVEPEECVNVGGQHTCRKHQAAHQSSTEGTNPTAKPCDDMTSDGSYSITDTNKLLYPFGKLTFNMSYRISTTLSGYDGVL